QCNSYSSIANTLRNVFKIVASTDGKAEGHSWDTQGNKHASVVGQDNGVLGSYKNFRLAERRLGWAAYGIDADVVGDGKAIYAERKAYA
ncbi:hypothetical protein, partial [Corallococcus praedator]|uniref:hypothetical protein n=1 Tax=Corallococcus praedator TaxID=2316724 RepID=UPI0013158F64